MNNYSMVCIADVHLGLNLYNIPVLGEDMKLLFISACDIAIEKDVNYFMVVGDLFESNRPQPALITFVAEQVQKLKDNGVLPIAIAGDHDMPIDNKSWMNVCGFMSPNTTEELVGFDFCNDSEKILTQLREYSNKQNVEWIFAHGQEMSLFPFVEEKKKFDFSSFPIFDLFPKLKGIILGDIHLPLTSKLSNLEKDIFLGYCGSLGITKSDEIGTKTGILYYDGETLSRIPYELPREYIHIDYTEGNVKNALEDITLYSIREDKPVFLVEYDETTENNLSATNILHDAGFVRRYKKFKDKEGKVSINIRSEISNSEKIDVVLRHLCPDTNVFNLAYQLVNSEDPKIVLNQFKQETLNQSRQG